LGANNTGRVDPVVADLMRGKTSGLGSETADENDIFTEYKQLMRDKFRNRPMPLPKK